MYKINLNCDLGEGAAYDEQIIPLNGTEQYLTKGTNFILILTFGREQSKIKRNHQNIILTKAIYLSIQFATLMTIIAKADLE